MTYNITALKQINVLGNVLGNFTNSEVVLNLKKSISNTELLLLHFLTSNSLLTSLSWIMLVQLLLKSLRWIPIEVLSILIHVDLVGVKCTFFILLTLRKLAVCSKY